MEHGKEKDILGVTLNLSIGVIVSLCVRCILLENLYLYSFVKQIFGSPTSHMRNVRNIPKLVNKNSQVQMKPEKTFYSKIGPNSA